ncbi:MULTISPECIES: hypothetical protein [Sphingomonas]|uniref:hypothetical protein n=1 Tax=Sphingomonas TaxID=13687 RepID=UPI00064BD31E|nr:MULTISPECIES: hypothetical protein [Sphingomonas]MBQ1481307.1 hypothetical protein [Sphingomonas sp.]
MTTQDPAAQLVGWLGKRAAEAIVARAIEPIAKRAGRRLARQIGHAAIAGAKRRVMGRRS